MTKLGANQVKELQTAIHKEEDPDNYKGKRCTEN